MAEESWTIGSNSSCDLVVENPTVSGRHCRLTRDGSTFVVEDLGSTNGTYVDGRRADHATTVTPADRVTLGLSEPMPWPDVVPGANSADGATNPPEDRSQLVTIGRSPENDIVLSGSNVSSRHARLMISPGGIILEDLGSTNGTSVGTVENKVLRSEVEPGDTVFLGSTPFRVSELLLQLESSNGRASERMQGGVPVPVKWLKQRATVIVAAGLGCVIAGALVFGILVAGDRSPKPSPQASAAAQPGTRGQEPEILEVAAGDPSRGPETEERGSLPVDEPERPEARRPSDATDADALTPEQKIKQSLFLIVCEDPDDQMPFRVGTGFAISAHRVATSASVINAMRDLQDNGFSRCMLYSPATTEELPIASAEVHPQHRQANSKAREAKQRHDDMIAQFEAEPPDPNELESIKPKLIDARMNALKAIEEQTSYDVGILEVDRELSPWLSGVDPDASLRPNMKLRVSGYAFDIQDPYFEPSASVEVSSMTGRLRQLQRVDRDSPPRVLATASEEQSEYAYLGSPATDEQGNVVAVYSRPTPPRTDDESSPPAETFDAPLYARLREWLAKR